jgi:putative PIN family toxin of toxin-antitoxin system
MVLDTDVVVAAILSAQGASRAILESISEGVGIALISVPLLIEYEAVLSRPNLMKEAGLDRREVDMVLDGLALIMEPVGIHYLWRPLLADPYDDMVLETAVNGQAAAIVSFNVKDYGDIPASFGMDLLQPRDAIKRLRSP